MSNRGRVWASGEALRLFVPSSREGSGQMVQEEEEEEEEYIVYVHAHPIISGGV